VVSRRRDLTTSAGVVEPLLLGHLSPDVWTCCGPAVSSAPAFAAHGDTSGLGATSASRAFHFLPGLRREKNDVAMGDRGDGSIDLGRAANGE